MPDVTIAYRTLGTLAPNRDNVVLVTHGNTSGPQMIDPDGSTGEGSWKDIVGPGKPVDTNRYFAICPNMLGSSYGSTNAASIDPATGKPYGPRFPDITVGDIVATQHALLGHLGIERLVAIVGPSYGGFQALPVGGELSRHDARHRRRGHLACGAARTIGRQCRAPAHDVVKGSELERRRLLRSRRRAGDHDPDPHRRR